MNLEILYKGAKKVSLPRNVLTSKMNPLPCEAEAVNTDRKNKSVLELATFLKVEYLLELSTDFLRIAKPDGMPAFAVVPTNQENARLSMLSNRQWVQDFNGRNYLSVGKRTYSKTEKELRFVVKCGIGATIGLCLAYPLIGAWTLLAIVTAIVSGCLIGAISDEIRGNTHEYHFKFNGLVPEKIREKVRLLRSAKYSTVLVCEADSWEKVSLSVDPLLCVVLDDRIFVVDKFDLTPMEQYLHEEFTVEKRA